MYISWLEEGERGRKRSAFYVCGKLRSGLEEQVKSKDTLSDSVSWVFWGVGNSMVINIWGSFLHEYWKILSEELYILFGYLVDID